MTARTPTSRPGGRTARVRGAVLDAADELTAEGHDCTIRALSQASGVSEPTIYRRWRTVENVLVDAAVRQVSRHQAVPASGELRTDLLAWATTLERSIDTPAGLRFLTVLVRARAARADAAADALAPFVEQRIAQLRELLSADRAPAWLTVDLLLDRVLAPLYVRQLLGYRAERDARALVDDLLDRGPAATP